MIRLIFSFLLLSFLSGRACLAQSPHFQVYSLLKKRETVQTHTIFQDKEGFLWFGTNRGLFQYDGFQFNQYTKKDSLPDEDVTAIAQDSLGRIWTGHKNGGIACFEGNRFSKFVPEEGLSSNEVSDMLFDKEGRLWFSTLNDGLYYYNNQRLYRLDEMDGMPDLFIYDIEEDDQGQIWAGTDGGAVQCVLKEGKAQLTVFNYSSGLPDNIVKKIRATGDGSLLIATEDAGIVRFEPIKKSVSPLTKSGWNFGTVTDFIVDDSRVWITAQHSVVVVDQVSGEVNVYNPPDVKGTFAAPTSILKDEEGNIWLGSHAGVARSFGNYIEYIVNLGNNGLTPDDVVALSQDKNGNIWFANKSGLFKWIRSGKTNSIQPQLRGTAYEHRAIISLYTDEQGFIWAGLYGEGALRIHPESGKISYFNKELRNGNVLNISGKGNTVWLATLGGASQITIGKNLEIKNYGSDNGLSSDYIYQVLVDSKDRVWFATDGKGVDMKDEKGFHHFSEGLTSKVVYSIAEDDQGNIWVNTQEDGLFKLEANKFVPFIGAKKLRDNNIAVLASNQSGLIVMHDLGVDLIDTRTNNVRYIGEEAGMAERRANLNAVITDNNGRLLIGTDKGIIRFTKLSAGVLSAPRPQITSLKIFDQKWDKRRANKLSYDQNNLTLQFSGLWYQNPQAISFQYKMENYDREWIDTRDRLATYSSLPPGQYTFKVRASETGDFSDASEVTLDVRISPPFWRTVPFYFSVVVVLAFAGYTFLKLREERLRRYSHLLEEKVKQRTVEIQKKNEEILAQAEEIKSINDNLEELVEERTADLEKKNKALEEYAFITAHNLRAPVASILGLINLTSKLELKEEDKELLARLKVSADKLDGICREITKAIERGDT